VLFTANDAYMRDFNLYVPADCIASNTIEENRHALELMEKVLKANVTPSTELDLEELKRQGGEESKPRPQVAQFAKEDRT
jgi:nicotinamidase-related amidase